MNLPACLIMAALAISHPTTLAKNYSAFQRTECLKVLAAQPRIGWCVKATAEHGFVAGACLPQPPDWAQVR